MIPDSYILSRRAKVVREMPWPISGSVLMEMRDEDLDALDMTRDDYGYWRCLNEIVTRIEFENRLTNVNSDSEER